MIFKKKSTAEAPKVNTMLHKELSFAATEAYKLLRTNLMFTLPDEKKCRVVGITSSGRGDGKSTTAINLSYTLAETGKRVIIIDADLRLPTAAEKLGIKATPGLSNVLAGAEREDDVVRSIGELENWFVLPSGDIPPNPTEMLASTQMHALVERLSESYDYIIIDLPPVNIVSDALVVSSMLDGIIVVVREGHSGRRELALCMRQLDLAGVKVLGFVVNNAGDGTSPYRKYKYYKRYGKYDKYGYSHSYGKSPRSDDKKAKSTSEE